MQTPGLLPLEPAGRAALDGLAPAALTTAREERSFEREVERAAERAGGDEAREARRAELRAAHRAERRAGFGEADDARRAPRDAGERRDRAADAADAPEAIGVPAVPGSPQVPRAPEPRIVLAEPAPEPPPAGRRDGAGTASPSASVGSPATLAGPATTGSQTGGATGAGATAAGAAPGTSAQHGAAALADGPRTAERAAPNRGATEVREGRPAPPEPQIDHAHELLRQVRLHLADGVREASLSLVPAHLGRLQIKLSVAGGKVDAVVRAESPETLELIERHLPELRDALAREGLASGELRLELGLHADHDHDRAGARAGREPAAARPAASADDPAGGDRRLAQLLQRLSPAGDGVDTYA